MGEEFLLPLVFSSGNVILLKRPDGGMADTRDLKSLGLSVRVRVPLRAPPFFLEKFHIFIFRRTSLIKSLLNS